MTGREVGPGEGGGGALSQSGEATARLSGRDAARGAPSGRRAVSEGRRLGFSAYCPHCFIVLFDPRLLVSCDVELPGIFQQPAKLLARWLDGPMHYRFLSRRGHRPVVGARSVRHDQRR
jgi:hypothetical protein